jgi:hypothetical protein
MYKFPLIVLLSNKCDISFLWIFTTIFNIIRRIDLYRKSGQKNRFISWACLEGSIYLVALYIYLESLFNNLPENFAKFSDLLYFSILGYTTAVTRSRVSSGSIVSDYGLDDRAIGVRSPAGTKDFSSGLCVHTGSGTHPASCTMCTRGKARPRRDADHSPPSSAEVVSE